jgi:DnaJ-domain-containing protein 1
MTNAVMNTLERTGSRRLRELATATLLRRFHEKCSRAELYDKAVRCYDILLECLHQPFTAKEISELVHLPENTVTAYAGKIVDILLFNDLHDPYLSFGLRNGAQTPEITRRWKGLMLLYHPDKYLNRQDYEEKAKKINSVYEKILAVQKEKSQTSSFTGINEMHLPEDSSSPGYSRYLPSVIFTLAIISAIFSVLLFIIHLLINDSSILS